MRTPPADDLHRFDRHADASWWATTDPGLTNTHTVPARDCMDGTSTRLGRVATTITQAWLKVRNPTLTANDHPRPMSATSGWIDSRVIVAAHIADALAGALNDPTVADHLTFTYTSDCKVDDTIPLPDHALSISITDADLVADLDNHFTLPRWTGPAVVAASAISHQRATGSATVASLLDECDQIRGALRHLDAIDPAIIDTEFAATYVHAQPRLRANGPGLDELVDNITAVWNPH